MRSLSVILLALSVCALFTADLKAVGLATSMGQLQTVSTDGAFDVLRNPATLANQKKENSIGLGIMNLFYNSYDISNSVDTNVDMEFTGGDLEMDLNETDFDMAFDYEISMPCSLTGSAAYSRRITDNLTIGAAISETYEKETIKNNMTTSIFLSGTVTSPFSGTMEMTSASHGREEEEHNTYITSFTPAGAFMITDKLSGGLQFSIENKYQKSKHDDNSEAEEVPCFNSSCDPADIVTSEENSSSENITQSYKAGLGTGLYYKSETRELGIIMTFGEYSWEKNSYESKYFNDSTDDEDDENYSIDDSLKYKGNYTEGPSFFAGYYQRLNSILAIAIEAGIAIPVEYNYTTLSDNGGEYIEEDVTFQKKLYYTAAAGLEFDITGSLKIGTGFRYIKMNETEKSESRTANSSSTSEEDNKFDIYSGTLGVVYNYEDTLSFTLFSALYYIKIDGTSNIKTNESDTGSKMDMKMDLEMEMKIKEIFAGVSADMTF